MEGQWGSLLVFLYNGQIERVGRVRGFCEKRNQPGLRPACRAIPEFGLRGRKYRWDDPQGYNCEAINKLRSVYFIPNRFAR